jgi:hypothetical protein
LITVVGRSDLDERKYEELIEKTSNVLIYTHLSYLDAVASFTKSELYFVLDITEEKFNAAIPFCLYRGRYGPVINSLPFYGSNGGIIAMKDAVCTAEPLLQKLIEFARQVNSISVTVIESPLNQYLDKVFANFSLKDSRISFLNNFTIGMNPENLIKQFQEPRPRNIRRAQSAGIEVRQSHSQEAIDFLSITHEENITSIGGLAKPPEFFEILLTNLSQENWVIFEALLDGKRIASLLLLQSKNVIEYFTPAVLPEFRSLQALSLLIFQGMQFAIKNEIEFWNWGGTWESQTGVFDYKKKWASQKGVYKYHTLLLDESLILKKKEDLLDAYPYFYVLPFGSLQV